MCMVRHAIFGVLFYFQFAHSLTYSRHILAPIYATTFILVTTTTATNTVPAHVHIAVSNLSSIPPPPHPPPPHLLHHNPIHHHNNNNQHDHHLMHHHHQAMGARHIATWEVHECNVGPQPQWLFDAVDAFLDAPEL